MILLMLLLAILKKTTSNKPITILSPNLQVIQHVPKSMARYTSMPYIHTFIRFLNPLYKFT